MSRSLTSFLAVAVLAAGPSQSATAVLINIQPQSLSGALQEFAMQSGCQILYPAERVLSGVFVKEPIEGRLSPEVALSTLLKGTGMDYEFINARTVSIHQNSTEPDLIVSRAPEQGPEAVDHPPASVNRIPEILVKGSRSLNVDLERSRDDIQPYVVLNREAIQKSGAHDVGDLLRAKLTMNYAEVSNNFLQGNAQPGSGNASSVALRGFNASETLILVDGRRVGGRGALGQQLQPDLNRIPLSAIERIEVLPTTAVGVYGGSATAGVVNVILRRDYTGAEVGLAFESSTRGDGQTRRAEFATSLSTADGNTNLVVNGSYSDSTAVIARDRPFYREYIERLYAAQAVQSPSTFVPLGQTTNILSSTGQMLVLDDGTPLNSTITSVPRGYAGVASDGGAALVANAGSFNRELPHTVQVNGLGGGLTGAPTVGSVTVTGRHRFGRFEAFLDLSASRNDQYFIQSSSTSFFSLPATAAANPFRQAIRVSTPLFADGTTTVTRSRDQRALFGLKMSLPSDWHSEIDYSYDRNDLEQSNSGFGFNSQALTAVRTGIVDLFKDGEVYPNGLSSYIQGPTVYSPTHSIGNNIAVRAAGPLFVLPGGPVETTVVVEGRREKQAESAQVSPDFFTGAPVEFRVSAQAERIISTYVEARLPIVSKQNALPWLKLVEMQVAGRYERYWQTGSVILTGANLPLERPANSFDSADPTIGFMIAPLDSLKFRFSYGTGFRPARLSQLNPSLPITVPAGSTNLRDPRRGDEPLSTVTLQSGGNPNLKPESLGSLRVSVDWAKITRRDNITSILFSQDYLNQEEFLPGIVTRAPASANDPFGVGPISGFNGALVNALSAETESYDLSVDFEIPMPAGHELRFSASGTRLMHKLRQLTALAPEQESVGLVDAPEWAGLASLSWTRLGYNATWTARYTDTYWLTADHQTLPLQGSDHVASSIFHDVVARVRVSDREGAALDMFSNFEVTAGIKNVFDRKPNFNVNYGNLYDPWANPIMRSYFVSIRKEF
jgi:iron complex outermembrane receptor protein